MRRLVIAAMIGLVSVHAALASRITTKDGTVLTGEVEALSAGTYTIKTPYGSIKVPVGSVISITSDQPSAAPASAPSQSGPLRFAGSTTIGDELMPAIIERYAADRGFQNPHWTIENNDPSEQAFSATATSGQGFEAHLSRHGSATAFTALQSGTADIGMASRPVNKDEVGKLRAAGLGDAEAIEQEHVLALDGLVVLISRSNPIERLSLAQLAAIFSGETKDWQEVGGSPGPIHVFGRDAKSGSADTFKGTVLKDKTIAPAAQLMDSSDGLSDKVAADPGAIGFAGFAYVRRAKPISIQTDCGLEVAPTDFFVRTEEYPLSRRLLLYAKAPAADEAAHRFIGFALGHAGQEEAARKGFVDLLPRLSATDYSATRIATALSQAAKESGDTSSDMRSLQVFNKIADGGRRLSITFRFRSASFDLDTRSVRDIDRLVTALKSPGMQGNRLTIVGFSDAQGTPARNIRLAQARADKIAGMLRAKGVTPRLVTGLGRAAPVACNSSPEGLQKNRRVEIWLAPPPS